MPPRIGSSVPALVYRCLEAADLGGHVAVQGLVLGGHGLGKQPQGSQETQRRSSDARNLTCFTMVTLSAFRLLNSGVVRHTPAL